MWNHAPPSFLAPALTAAPLFSRHSFSTSSSLSRDLKKVKKHDHRDSYALRQAKARKDANLSRQAVLKEQRAKELGDPIRGITTPFVESLDTVVSHTVALDADAVSLEALTQNPDKPPPSPAHASEEQFLGHGLQHEELDKAMEYSRWLTEPTTSTGMGAAVPQSGRETNDHEKWEKRDATAAEAVQRIVSLANSSSMHRTKKNIERIIETFGRHQTDKTLKPKPAAVVTGDNSAAQATPRAGPDTGSSEVQIGILTAKIRVLADRYEGENRNDKINKRNLRLLLHRRQKLLKYMEKKERGSERWQHMIKTLGITPACWKGEIAVE